MPGLAFDFKTLTKTDVDRKLVKDLERKYKVVIENVEVSKRAARRSGLLTKYIQLFTDRGSKAELLIKAPTGEVFQIKINGRAVPTKTRELTNEKKAIWKIADLLTESDQRKLVQSRKAKVKPKPAPRARKTLEEMKTEAMEEKGNLEEEIKGIDDKIQEIVKTNTDKNKRLTELTSELSELSNEADNLQEQLDKAA